MSLTRPARPLNHQQGAELERRNLYSGDARKADYTTALNRSTLVEANRNWLAGRTSKRAVSKKNQSGRLTEQAEAINMAAAIAVVTL